MSANLIGDNISNVMSMLKLAAIGVLIAAAFLVYKSMNTVSDINVLVSNARAAFSMGPNGYTNMTTANIQAMIDGGLFNGTQLVKGGVVTDQWGNSMTFASANGGSQGVIGFGGGGSESVEECAKTTTSIGDFVSLKVGSTTFTPQNRPDAIAATAACKTGLAFTLTIQ